MKLFHVFGAAAAATGIAVAALATVIRPAPQEQPKPHQPMRLASAAPLVAVPVKTETFTRQGPAAAPVRVILANPYGASIAPAVAPPIAVAKIEPKAEAPKMEPPWVEEVAKEPRRHRDRERERRAQSPPPRGDGESSVCTRHNLRKVWVSDRRWRCKK